MTDKPAPEIFETQVGQKVSFSGEIVDEPSMRQNNQQLTVEVAPQGLALGSLKARPLPATEKTKVFISADLDQTFKYGDQINFTGKLKKPENFLTGDGKIFDYINYFARTEFFI